MKMLDRSSGKFVLMMGVVFTYVLCDWNFVQAQPSTVRRDGVGETRKAIERAIPSLEKAMVGYRENRRCFSCHHHAHAIVALSLMAKRGLDVDRERLQFQLARTIDRTRSVEHRYLKNQNIGGGIDTAGHALLAMQVGGHPPDPTTEAVVQWMLKRDQDHGYWNGIEYRAPTQTSNITRTWLCLNAFKHYGTKELADQIRQRKTKSRTWLLEVEAPTTEDKVSRIRALSLIGDADDPIKKFADELAGEQREDGGWAQEAKMQSDAYATGSVLITLHQFAGLSTDQEFYRRGIEYLKSTQLKDGTWHVKTRARAVQKYFESGFPHGRDQFISFTATCWAATALAFTLPEQTSRAKSLTSPILPLSGNPRKRFLARFKKEIWPLVTDNGELSCVRCHNEKHRSSFRLTGNAESDFEMMLAKGFLHSQDPSGILFPLTSKDKELMMPPAKLPRLSDKQIELLRQFVQDLNRARDDRKISEHPQPNDK